jgi:hypothetical protein
MKGGEEGRMKDEGWIGLATKRQKDTQKDRNFLCPFCAFSWFKMNSVGAKEPHRGRWKKWVKRDVDPPGGRGERMRDEG